MFLIAMASMPDPIVPPCIVALPLFVLINKMSSYVYRNIRFGLYRDYTIRTSFIDKAVQEQATSTPLSQEPVDIVFKPAATCSVHGTGIPDLEQRASSSERKSGDSLQEVETCSREDTMAKQQLEEKMDV